MTFTKFFDSRYVSHSIETIVKLLGCVFPFLFFSSFFFSSYS